MACFLPVFLLFSDNPENKMLATFVQTDIIKNTKLLSVCGGFQPRDCKHLNFISQLSPELHLLLLLQLFAAQYFL